MSKILIFLYLYLTIIICCMLRASLRPLLFYVIYVCFSHTLEGVDRDE